MIPCVLFVVPGCLMCAKVRDDLLRPYVKNRLISLTIQTVGISKIFPSYNPDLYDYGFLFDETGRAITPTIKIGDEIFLQAMTFETFSRVFEEELRHYMGGR